MAGSLIQVACFPLVEHEKKLHTNKTGMGKRTDKMMSYSYAPPMRMRTFSGLQRSKALDSIMNTGQDFHSKVSLATSFRSKRAIRIVSKATFERFTEKAIKVIMLAQEEACRLGHNLIGVEQILLGLVGEGNGIGAKVLKSMGISLKDARVEVEKIIGKGSRPFTLRAEHVLRLSVKEARQLGHNYIGSEHLLLGLLREGDNKAGRVLGNLGVDTSNIHTQVIRMVGEGAGAAVGTSNCNMPTLEEYGTNLIKLAEEIAFDGPSNVMLNPNIEDETEPFRLINPYLSREPYFRWRSSSTSREILGPGMILLKNFINIIGQVEIVNMCQKWGVGPAAFYQPSNKSGAKRRLHMTCFGRRWDPVTKYKKPYRNDGSEPPPLPDELISFAKAVIEEAQYFLHEVLPSMCPDVCVVNFYSPSGRLGLHQDCDESSDSLKKGLPVISISIGDSAEFLYGHTRDKKKLERVLLESGDVLVFGGKSRLIFHEVKKILSLTTPSPLERETNLIPGRLNLTLRQF